MSNSSSPNILLVVIDDMGFGASSAYGGPCRMPTADRLADGGLRFSRFHVTSLCSPTRQALMTGRNHHSVGMGVTTEMSTDQPGYNGVRPPSAATIGQLFKSAGYATAAFGKWHQTPPSEVGPDGPFDRWPVGEGFDHFYGFMGAEMNHWHPQLYENTTPIEPTRLPEDGYHLSEDLADRTIGWIRDHHARGSKQPFLAYLAFGATHAPFHVAPEWIERYRGEFDKGWDRQREETLARQKAMGVVPADTELAPWAEGVPHWDELSDPARRVAVRLMETYAGFAEHTDAQVGRVVDALAELGELDDTLIVWMLGDNGASGEGGIEGTLREHLVGHGLSDDVADMDARVDEIGSPTTYALYPVGWALAMNTPYQWTKQVASHFGGIRDGLIVHWPRGIADSGTVRHQFHHVIDVLPTLLEAAGVAIPETVAGVPQKPIEGTSMAYCFDDDSAPEARTRQYFEMIGNRSIYDDGWTAGARHSIPWRMVEEPRGFDQDRWELYDVSTDFSQSQDLAEVHPERLAQMKAIFDEEASRYQVFPLDDRVTERENPQLAGRPDPRAGRLRFEFGPDTRRLTEEVAPNVKNRSHRLRAQVHVEDGVSGVIVAQGGRFGGWSFYCVDGFPTYCYNRFGRDVTIIGADEPVTAGNHELLLDFRYLGGPEGSGAEVEILIDGVPVGHGELEATTAYYFAFDETFNVGVDLGSPVSPDYAPARNAFTGEISALCVELAEESSDADQADSVRAVRSAD